MHRPLFFSRLQWLEAKEDLEHVGVICGNGSEGALCREATWNRTGEEEATKSATSLLPLEAFSACYGGQSLHPLEEGATCIGGWLEPDPRACIHSSALTSIEDGVVRKG